MSSELYAPLALAALFGGFAVYASWRAAKPADPLKPRMLPWRPLLIISATAAILILAWVSVQLGWVAPPPRI